MEVTGETEVIIREDFSRYTPDEKRRLIETIIAGQEWVFESTEEVTLEIEPPDDRYGGR